MSGTLLLTKLNIPSTRKEWVIRPRLIKQLNKCLERKIALVSAPAGFGKTTLLSAWAAACDLPVAWFSVDEDDNDPVRFMEYLVAALQKIEPSITVELSSRFSSPRQSVSALINQLEQISRPLILILDDYHTITETQIHDLLIFLIERQPTCLHLVIAGRADPPWPLARLRASGQLAELRSRDLRFLLAETVEFLNDTMKLRLAIEDIQRLEIRTEGWIAGLHLAAIALQSITALKGENTPQDFIASFTGSNRFVFDYLIQEVLERQPEAVHEFLLATSILEQLTASLCEALLDNTGTSRQTLDYLERSNLFLTPLDNERRWYRYHPLRELPSQHALWIDPKGAVATQALIPAG